jgi:NAD(P)H-dependent FMN reductase
MPLKLHTIICSTRPVRVGPAVARWFDGVAQAHEAFEAELIDLKDFGLPVLDEPHHPRLQQYEHDHTKAWAASVTAADAYIFVLPEYNTQPPPSFVNAVDYLAHEWGRKAAGFVSYGGLSGGVRSVQTAKLLMTSLNVMPITGGVAIPLVGQHLKDGVFEATPGQETTAKALLDELALWAQALKDVRAKL